MQEIFNEIINSPQIAKNVNKLPDAVKQQSNLLSRGNISDWRRYLNYLDFYTYEDGSYDDASVTLKSIFQRPWYKVPCWDALPSYELEKGLHFYDITYLPQKGNLYWFLSQEIYRDNTMMMVNQCHLLLPSITQRYTLAHIVKWCQFIEKLSAEEKSLYKQYHNYGVIPRYDLLLNCNISTEYVIIE